MLVDDPIVMIIFLLSYIAFFLLTQLYSLTYHLTIAMIGLCAVLSIFPITSGSLKGAVKSSLWCVLMPFVVAIILCLIGDSDAFFKTYSGGIVQNLESLIQLLIMTIILLLSPMITSKVMSDSGVSHVAESLGQMAGMATLIGGASFASKFVGGKASSIGGMIHNSTSRPALNKVKDSFSQKAQAISKEKGLGPSIKTLTSKNPFEKAKGRMSDIGENIKSTSFKEKAILGVDSIINKKENSIARSARLEDVNKSNPKFEGRTATKGHSANSAPRFNRPDPRESKVPLSRFKREASDYLRTRDELVNRPKLSGQFKDFRSNEGRLSNGNMNLKMGKFQSSRGEKFIYETKPEPTTTSDWLKWGVREQ